MFNVLLFAWGAIALLLIGVRIGWNFGHEDALEEISTPRRRELREVARWLDPALVRRRRLLRIGLWLFLAGGFVLWAHR